MGKYLVIISGHCIPKNNTWLQKLIEPLENDQSGLLAGVYGRQEPLSSSSPLDKRDLTVVFGLDERTQKKDSFFHNANSIIKRDVWEKSNFNNEVENIEDRIWAGEILKKNYKIKYTPKAPVYHYHGIHQSGNSKRLEGVTKITVSYTHLTLPTKRIV